MFFMVDHMDFTFINLMLIIMYCIDDLKIISSNSESEAGLLYNTGQIQYLS